MNCPNCAAPIGEHMTDYGDCAVCGLAGPRDVLEALAARLAPAGVLAEAERLLRTTPLFAVCLDDMFVGADWWTEGRDGEDAMDCGQFETLAEAYEKLTKGERNG